MHNEASIKKFFEFVWFRAKANKILLEYSLSNQFSCLGEGRASSIVNSVTTLWCFIKVVGVYSGYGGGHHAEVERVGNGMMVPGLAFCATDFLLDLFEIGYR